MKFAAATAGVALFGKAVKDAINFEAELFNVRKTTNLTIAQVKKLGDSFIELSTKTGVARTKLAAIGVVAGQLGIVSKAGGGEAGLRALEKFTEVVAKSRLAMPDFADSAEDASKKVAKLLNIMNLTVDEAESLMSAINELSNTTAADADQIAEFTRRLGGTAIALGSTADKVTALSATMVEVGINAELGGTAITRLLVKVQKNLDDFTEGLGASGAAFKKAFVQDPIIGLQMLFEQMSRMNKEDQFKFMDALSINSVRLIGVMNKLSQTRGVESLAKALKTSNKAFNASVSIQKEFELRMESTQSHVERLMAALGFVGQTLAEQLFPVIKDLSLAMAKMFASTDFQNNVKALGSALATFFMIIGAGIKIVIAYREAFIALGSAMLLLKLNALIMPLQKTMILLGLGSSSSLAAARGIKTLALAFRFLGTSVGTANKAYTASAVIQGVQARNAAGQFTSGLGIAFGTGTKGAGAFKTLGAAAKGAVAWVAALGRALVGLALAHPVIAILLGIGAAIIFLVKKNRELKEGLERLNNFGKDFEFIKGFGEAGDKAIEQVDKVSNAVEKYNDALKSISRTEKRKLIFDKDFKFPSLEKAREEINKLKKSLKKLEDIGEIDIDLFDVLFEKKGDLWIVKEGKEAEAAMKSLKKAMEDFQKESERFVDVFENIRSNVPDLGISELLEEAEREFDKFGEKTQAQMDAVREQLIISLSKQGEVGTAFGVGLAKGITSNEVKTMLKNAAVTITDVQLQAMRNNAEKAKEPATMLYAVFAQELISSEKARELFEMGEKLTVSVINGAQQESLQAAMKDIGRGLGAGMMEGLGEAVSGGVAALEEFLGMSLAESAPLKKFAQAADAAAKIAERVSFDGGGKGSDAAAKKAAKEREEQLKRLLELEKQNLEITKKRAELEKESIKAAAEGRDLTEEEAAKLKEINGIMARFPSHLYDINERIDGVIESTKAWGESWEEAQKRVADLRKELTDLDDEMKKNREEFEKLYGKEPGKIGGEAALALAGEMGRKVAELEAEREAIKDSIGTDSSRKDAGKRLEEIQKEILFLNEKNKAVGKSIVDSSRELEAQEAKIFALRAQSLIMQDKGAERYQQHLDKIDEEQKKLEKLQSPIIAEDTASAFVAELERGRQINEANTEAEKEYLKTLFDIRDKRAEMNKEEEDQKKSINDELKEAISNEKELGAVQQERMSRTSRMLDRLQTRLSKLTEAERAKITGEKTEAIGFTEATGISADGDVGISGDKGNAENDEIENQQRITSRGQALDRLLKLEQDHLATLAGERTSAWSLMISEMMESYKAIRKETKTLTDALIKMWNAVFSAMVKAAGAASSARKRSGGAKGGKRGGYADDFMRGFQPGGFTANVGTSRPAGIVHGGEWVAPNWMVKRFPGLISGLEALRMGKAIRQFEAGGLVGNRVPQSISKTNEIKVEMVNHIRDQLDMRAVSEQLGYSLSNRILT